MDDEHWTLFLFFFCFLSGGEVGGRRLDDCDVDLSIRSISIYLSNQLATRVCANCSCGTKGNTGWGAGSVIDA